MQDDNSNSTTPNSPDAISNSTPTAIPGNDSTNMDPMGAVESPAVQVQSSTVSPMSSPPSTPSSDPSAGVTSQTSSQYAVQGDSGADSNSGSSDTPAPFSSGFNTAAGTPQVMGNTGMQGDQNTESIPTPPTATPPVGSGDVSSVMSTPGPKKSSGVFKILLIILILIALGGLGFAGYNYYLNSKTQKDTMVAPTVYATPTFDPNSIYIENGSIVQKTSTGESKILIDKNDMEGLGIAGFSQVHVSPNSKLLCFEALPPAPVPALYLSNIDGSNRVEVGINKKECTWSPDSAKLAYINSATDSGTSVDIFLYDVATSTEKNLTSGTSGVGFSRDYELVGWSQDSSKVVCAYAQTNTRDANDTKSGSCEINLTTGVVSDLPASTDPSTVQIPTIEVMQQ